MTNELNPIEKATYVAIAFSTLLEKMDLDPDKTSAMEFAERYQEIMKEADEYVGEIKERHEKKTTPKSKETVKSNTEQALKGKAGIKTT